MKPSVILALIIVAFSLSVTPVLAQKQPVVQIVFFFNPDCGHCKLVITRDLPPLQVKYGTQLAILPVDTSKPDGLQLYRSMVNVFQLSADRLGTPAIVAGDTVLVGSDEIPANLPNIVEEKLTSGGLGWPVIPGLSEYLANYVKANPGAGFTSDPQPTSIASASTSGGDSTIWDRFALNFKKDTIANSLAVIILLGMIISLIAVLVILVRSVLTENPSSRSFSVRGSIFLALVLVGLFVAGYLTYIELGKKPALCGPVGHCNEVQQSSYAKLFGVLPVGVIGLFGYAAILAAWGVYKFGPKPLHMLSSLALWGMSLFGVGFSIYLTFLEPFVIGATCMWCLSSALVMTALLWVTTPIIQESLTIEDIDDEELAEPEE